jgi:hypothetical protein
MPTLHISDESFEKIKDQVLAEESATNSSPDALAGLVGQKWFFRTVTYHLVGRVVKYFDNFFLLEDASWVADSGRFTQAIKAGKLNEVEPVGMTLVNLDSVVDAFPWTHALPTSPK